MATPDRDGRSAAGQPPPITLGSHGHEGKTQFAGVAWDRPDARPGAATAILLAIVGPPHERTAVPVHTRRPACFVALPAGGRPTDSGARAIHADVVWEVVARAITAAGLDPVRADVRPDGGFVDPRLDEALLVAEYVVADLTGADATVVHVVGIRQASPHRPTVLVGQRGHDGGLPPDLASRLLPYGREDTRPVGDAPATLEQGVTERLREAAARPDRVDHPLLALTTSSIARLEHDKTDVFLARLDDVAQVDDRVSAALDAPEGSVAGLAALEREVLGGGGVVAHLDTTLMAIFLSYRTHEAWQHLVDLFDRLPRELRATAVAREQLALALNRLAEEADRAADDARDDGDDDAAQDHAATARWRRRAALEATGDLPAWQVTAETWAIRGRIHKGEMRAMQTAGNDAMARAARDRAIDAYDHGVRADLRDYYPGVNAVTLRRERATPEDRAVLDDLLPVVRMAAAVAPPAHSTDERYWRTATRVELAAMDKDFAAARQHLDELLDLDVAPWMHTTTRDNLGIHARLFTATGDDDAASEVAALVAALGT